ncbi:TniQ family protein [Streptomyces sp. NBC_01602]|uniref:TniQ family protein n=1 Tax=Streptomyces sp. NBC_01602 TaxID=2975893 RepID=UPI00386A5FA0|nr:TniQ family protein [Streptomyces sp. NBC_01602]
MDHARSLPYRVPLVDGESTGSYVTRLAIRHGQPVSHFLTTVGEGRSAASVDPWQSELYVNRAARRQLAAMTGRSLDQLTRALVSLRDEHLLPGSAENPVWKWPWRPHSGYVVRACALCAARRGVLDPVWLIRPDSWHICVRHGRFHDNSHDGRDTFIDVSPAPHVIQAERRRLRLVRSGPAGRLLVADAFGVLAHEAVRLPRLGSSRTTPLRLLPIAVRVAFRMASLEQRRLEHRLRPDEHQRWLEQAAKDLGWRLGTALVEWSRKHPPLEGVPAEHAQQRWQLLLAAPHQDVPEMAPVDKLACVPWEILARSPRPYG